MGREPLLSQHSQPIRINQVLNRRLQVFPLLRNRPALAEICLAIALLLGICADALALDPQSRFPDYVRDNWNIESGLPQISALSITQDSTGYIWVGTQSAITRFDGVRFTV